MTIAIETAGALAAPAAGTAQGAGRPLLQLAPLDGEQFRAQLAQQWEGARQAVAHAAAAAPAPGPGALGERVVQRAAALSGEMQNEHARVSQALEQASRSGDPQHLVQAMIALNEYQLRVQFMSRAAAKASAALDQLTKLQ